MSINIQGGFGLGMSHLMLNVENIISRIKKICCVSVSKAMSCKRFYDLRNTVGAVFTALMTRESLLLLILQTVQAQTIPCVARLPKAERTQS